MRRPERLPSIAAESPGSHEEGDAFAASARGFSRPAGESLRLRPLRVLDACTLNQVGILSHLLAKRALLLDGHVMLSLRAFGVLVVQEQLYLVQFCGLPSGASSWQSANELSDHAVSREWRAKQFPDAFYQVRFCIMPNQRLHSSGSADAGGLSSG